MRAAKTSGHADETRQALAPDAHAQFRNGIGAHQSGAYRKAVRASREGLTEDVIAQWIDAGLMHRVDDWLVQTIAGQYWHVTLAQLLIGLVGMRLGAGAVHERPAGNAAVFSGEKPAHG